MEKGKKKIDGEFQLPEAIIQHIQSLLGGKVGAQTSILSKSWYRAWSTRPHLHLDQRSFQNRDPNPQAEDGFSEFAKMTMQRYQEMKLKVESLKLCMEIAGVHSYLLVNEVIANAIMMGASDLDIEFLPQSLTLALPIQVLGFENLARLSATGCKIDQGNGKVSCSRLKSLSLCRAHIESELISEIIKGCPLIENLLLSNCRWKNKMWKLSSSVEFHKLKFLSLEKVRVDSLFFHDFSFKFPCLKELNLHRCFGYKARQIYSNSLERISIIDMISGVEFKVPSIRKFSFSGSRIPFCSIVTSSNKWESDISISCRGARLGARWFHRLKRLLRKLTLSKISLSLNFGFSLLSKFDYTEDVQSLGRPAVENLTLTMLNASPSVCSALLGAVFWSCCPKLITQYWLPKSCLGGKENGDFLEVLCKSLTQAVSENVCVLVPNRNMVGLLDLEEVTVEIFEESVGEWWLLHWKTLLDTSAFPEHKRKIRFQLRWRAEPNITFR